MAYTGLLEQSLATLADLGYDGVELMVRSPTELDVNRIDQLTNKNHLVVAAVGTGPLINEDRLALSDPDPEVRKAVVSRFKDVVDFAAAFAALMNVGRVRGRVSAGTPCERGSGCIDRYSSRQKRRGGLGQLDMSVLPECITYGNGFRNRR